MKSAFIFRRDLRTHDNTGLIKALKETGKVHPCFFFDPRQLQDNEYFSPKSYEFMKESLEELKEKIPELTFYKGQPHKHVSELNVDKIYVNKDYTPFSKKRDKKLRKACGENNVEFVQETDLLLTEPDEFTTNKGEPYKVFTYFYKKAKEKEISKPVENNYDNYVGGESVEIPNLGESFPFKAGRQAGLEKLQNLDVDYDRKDYPAEDNTTRLSPHLKFGTLSVREVYHEVNESIRRQLFWRDFFTHVASHWPRVFGNNFNEKYDALEWSYDKEDFKKWCDGKTGFPIVDAGMRQLNKTGWMHNRVRMIVASFLTKDLHIDWRWGEKYFAQKLVDYDPCLNNGNWQWAASTGCDAQPYFRIFNPWSQQEKYDPEATYVKKWVEELQDVNPNVIHRLYEESVENYPTPMVNHKEESEKAKSKFKSL